MRTTAQLFAVVWCFAATARADGPRPFLFLKTGEKFATQEAAGPTVVGLTAYVGEKVAGTTNAFEPYVMNDPVKAAEFSGKNKAALELVDTPATIKLIAREDSDPSIRKAAIQKLTDTYMGKIDAASRSKEKDILEIR